MGGVGEGEKTGWAEGWVESLQEQQEVELQQQHHQQEEGGLTLQVHQGQVG